MGCGLKTGQREVYTLQFVIHQKALGGIYQLKKQSFRCNSQHIQKQFADHLALIRQKPVILNKLKANILRFIIAVAR